MDPETEQHIEDAKRPAEYNSLRRMAGQGTVPGFDVPSDVLDPAVRLHQMRDQRARERLQDQMDRLVPVVQLEVTDRTVEVVNAEGEIEEIEHWSGTLYRIETSCLSCDAELFLDSIEPPELMARAVAAGILRRRPGTIRCDGCIAQAELEAERAETEAAQRSRLTNSGLDTVMHDFEFKQMRTADGRKLTIDAARNWAASEFPEPRGLCIFGPKGTGKTRLAGTATRQRVRRWPLTWVSWPILLAQLGAAFNDSARAKAISVLTGKGGLVLDDIAQERDEKVSDWAKRQVFAAVDRRVQAGAPLLITTNLNPSEIGLVLGEKLMSRIVGYCRVLELPGEDMRLSLNFDGTAQKDGTPLPDDFLPEPAPGEYLTDPDQEDTPDA